MSIELNDLHGNPVEGEVTLWLVDQAIIDLSPISLHNLSQELSFSNVLSSPRLDFFKNSQLTLQWIYLLQCTKSCIQGSLWKSIWYSQKKNWMESMVTSSLANRTRMGSCPCHWSFEWWCIGQIGSFNVLLNLQSSTPISLACLSFHNLHIFEWKDRRIQFSY